MTGYVSYYALFKSSHNNQYYFTLHAGNGEPIGQSEGYLTKQSAENGIASCRTHSPFDAYYERRSSHNGQHYFILKAANHKPILVSETYVNKTGMENGIASCKGNAPSAAIKDLVGA